MLAGASAVVGLTVPLNRLAAPTAFLSPPPPSIGSDDGLRGDALPYIRALADSTPLAVASSFNTWQSVCDAGHAEVVLFERFVDQACSASPNGVQDPVPFVAGMNASSCELPSRRPSPP